MVFGVLLIGVLFSLLSGVFLRAFIMLKFKRKHHLKILKLVREHGVAFPLRLIFMFISWSIIVRFEDLPKWAISGTDSLGIFACALFAIRIIRVVESWIVQHIDSPLVQFTMPLRHILQVMISFTAMSIFFDEVGYNPLHIAGGLIGGLLLAVASTSIVSSLFGLIIILKDRPFDVGDTIAIKGNKGVVQEIGVRGTVIQKRNGSTTMLPNHLFTKNAVENISRQSNF